MGMLLGLYVFVALLCNAVTSESKSGFQVLSTGKEVECNGTFCTICLSGDRHHSEIRSIDSHPRALARRKRQAPISDEDGLREACDEWKTSGQVTMELAIFADHALYQEFHRRYPSNSTELKLRMQEFIFSIVQQAKELFASPTLKPKVNLEIVEYRVILHKFRRFSLKKVRQDMPSYMDSFCRYQRQLNIPKRWDHAVLFTGFDLIHSIHQGNFAGYSSARSVCGPLSCSLVEASTFKSAYTLAHEIGHSLGMNHDNGSDACPSNCCLMSPIIFSGSQNWSRCSVDEFQEYLESIPCDKFCLNEPNGTRRASVKLTSSKPIMPGQAYTAPDQCRQFFGSCSKPYVNDMDHLETICSELWCTYHDGTMRLAHAALEGTYCGAGKWCRFGKCIKTEEPLDERPGEWSEWISAPSDGSCGFSGCSKKELHGQLSVQRQLRSCSNPSPNNGGAECQGEMYRGLICNDEHDSENHIDENHQEDSASSQRTIVDFASQICLGHKQRAELENDTFVSLSGRGFQRIGDSSEPNSCYAWCSTVNASFTSYTFFDAFPDGTSCGENRYCVSGKCMPRHRCNSTLALIASEIPADCKTDDASSRNGSSKLATSKITVFSSWSDWSECSRTCGIGVKRRVRLCTPANSTTCSKLSNTQQHQFCRGSVNKCQQTEVTTTLMTTTTGRAIDEKTEDGIEMETNGIEDEVDNDEADADLDSDKQSEGVAPLESSRTSTVKPLVSTAKVPAATPSVKPTTKPLKSTTSTVKPPSKSTTTVTTKRNMDRRATTQPPKAQKFSSSTPRITISTSASRKPPTASEVPRARSGVKQKPSATSTPLRSPTTSPKARRTTPRSPPIAASSGSWSQWSDWGECSSKCNGHQRATRTCTPSGAVCRGPETKRRMCNARSKC